MVDRCIRRIIGMPWDTWRETATPRSSYVCLWTVVFFWVFFSSFFFLFSWGGTEIHHKTRRNINEVLHSHMANNNIIRTASITDLFAYIFVSFHPPYIAEWRRQSSYTLYVKCYISCYYDHRHLTKKKKNHLSDWLQIRGLFLTWKANIFSQYCDKLWRNAFPYWYVCCHDLVPSG